MTPEHLQASLNIILIATLIGVTAGLRPAVALAAASWSVVFGGVPLEGTPVSLLAHPLAPWILAVVAVVEVRIEARALPERRHISGRIAIGVVVGAIIGAAFAVHEGSVILGAAFGALGGVAGCLMGSDAYSSLVRHLGRRSFADIAEVLVVVIAIGFSFAPIGIQLGSP